MKKALIGFAMLAMSASVFAETPADSIATQQLSQLVMVHQDLQMILDRLKQAESNRAPTQDPATYCYFGDKAYSRGSSRDDQVCVRSGLVAGGGGEPLHWVSKQAAAHGNY